jgi:hypothetical protein
MQTNYKKPKFTDKWGYILAIELKTNLVSIKQKGGYMIYEQFGGHNTKQGSEKALKFYNQIINNK